MLTVDPEAPAFGVAAARTGPRPMEAVALALLLVVGWVVTGPRSTFMSDEGQAELQVDLLEDGTWVYDSPFDEPGGLDPDRTAMALRGQGENAEGATPYGKHPVYPALLWVARALVGWPGTTLVSIAGAVAAAWLASVLARELGARDPRPAFWLCGLASPLFFDGMIVLAHTVGAALAAAALLALVRLDRAGFAGMPLRRAGAPLALLAASLGGAVLLRNEVLLLAAGVALAAVVVGRAPLALRVVVAGAACGGAVAAWVLDRGFRTAILGAPHGQSPPAVGEGTGLAGRLHALERTLLDAGGAVPVSVRAALVLWVVALAATAGFAVRHPERLPTRVVIAVGATGAVLHALRLVAAEQSVIPGLVMAFPAVAVLGALLLAGRPSASSRLVAVAVAATGAAIAALQYDRGGGLEWGGRFFAILLPGLAALAVVALQRSGLRLDVSRTLLGTLLAIGVLTATGSVTSLRGFRSAAEDLGVAVAEAGLRAGPLDAERLADGHEPKPLVVTTEVLLPQILRPVFAEHDWLAPARLDLPELAGRLDAAGVDRFVLVSTDAGADLAVLRPWAVEAQVPTGRAGIDVLVVARGG